MYSARRNTLASSLTTPQIQNINASTNSISRVSLAPSTPSISTNTNSLGTPRLSLGPARTARTPNQQSDRTPSHQLQNMTSDMSNLTLESHYRASINSAANHQRTSLTSRASLGRRSSTSKISTNPSVMPTIKDPRPIREKSYQYSAIKSLIKFLAESSFDRPISPKILSSPSAKDFQAIFKFLYACLDQGYNWTDKKFEEEVPGLIKSLRYPFASDISKSHLYAVGSMHAWPSLLAMLQWMIELIQCCDHLSPPMQNNNESEYSFLASGTLMDTERSFFDYLSKSYKMFLSGDDHYESMQSELSANFENKTRLLYQEIQDIKDEISNIEKQRQMIVDSESPLVALEKEKIKYVTDIDKFVKFIQHQKSKISRLEESISIQKIDLQQTIEQIHHFEEDKIRLSAILDNQTIHPEDVERMKQEREQLSQTLEGLKKTKEEKLKIVNSKEQSFFNKVSALEHSIGSEYKPFAEKLSDYKNLVSNCHIGIDLGWVKSQGVYCLNLDLVNIVIPSVARLKESVILAHRDLVRQDGILQDSLDKLHDVNEDQRQEMDIVLEKIKKMTIQYQQDKDSFTMENKKNASEMESLEEELQKMKRDMAALYLSSQQQLQRSAIDYDQLERRLMEDKERIGRDVFQLLEILIEFKNHVETELGAMDDWISSHLTSIAYDGEYQVQNDSIGIA